MVHPLSATGNTTAVSAEIIAVGTELLLGEIVNTNATFFSQEMAALGVDVYYHTVVGDNPARLKFVLKQALQRSQILLVTGGLGPTDDDLTISTLANLLDVPLISDPEQEARIRQFFLTRDMPMSPTNLKQALRPESAVPLPNRVGTAPGLFWDVTQLVRERGWSDQLRYILCFPGVPREMKAMWQEEALPRLKSLLPRCEMLVSRYLKFIGLGESMLGERLRDLMASPSPTVSPYVSEAEVKIRIAVKASSYEAGLARITPVEQEIIKRVGQYCYGFDDDTLEGVVGQMLKDRQMTVAVAESCTGGLVSSRLTDVSGSSDYTLLNVVTYSNTAKEKLLGVDSNTLEACGAVCAEVACQMAEGVQKLSGCRIGLSLTGIAGPTGGSPEKPVGLVYIGLAGLTEQPVAKRVLVNPQYSRQQIKFWFSQYALNFLRLYLQGLLDPDQQ